MNDNPLISIIMPAYNAEKTISESIESVLKQTYQNWELLVVNDGSKDNTSSVVKLFNNARIKLIEQVNGGVANARNNGIRQAQGEYIAFLDSDDLWLDEKLERQITFYQHNSEFGLVYTDKKCFYERIEDAFYCKYKEPINIDDDYLRLLTHDYIATLTVMTKKEVLDKIGTFDTELFGTEDWDLWIRIAKDYKIGYIVQDLAYYREHSAGISKNRERHLKEEWKVIEKHVLSNKALSKSVIDNSLWVWHKEMSIHYFIKNEIFDFFKFAIKCLSLNPINTIKFILLNLNKLVKCKN